MAQLNEQQRAIVQQTIIKATTHQRRVGFWPGVIAGVMIGLEIGAVFVYNRIGQVVVLSVGPKAES